MLRSAFRCHDSLITSSKSQRDSRNIFKGPNHVHMVVNYSHATQRIVAARNERYSAQYEDDLRDDWFWQNLAADTIGGLKSLRTFLEEQPTQFKHIEWPTFESMVKTAGLTLIIVALLMIALSSVDALLCYVMAWTIKVRT